MLMLDLEIEHSLSGKVKDTIISLHTISLAIQILLTISITEISKVFGLSFTSLTVWKNKKLLLLLDMMVMLKQKELNK